MEFAKTKPLGAVLLGLLRSDLSGGGADWSPPATVDWTDLIEFSRRHGVAPMIADTLRQIAPAGMDAAGHTLLGDARRATALENLRHYAEYGRIAQAFRRSGIPLMALKGLHLAELVYDDIGRRPMVDMDILVPPDRVAQAMSALRDLDYGTEADGGAAATTLANDKCNTGLTHRANGVYVELHWALSEPSDGYAAPMEDIWRSARPGRLGDTDTLVMAPEFLLLHVSAHLACNHGFAFALRGLCDVAAITHSLEIDWDLFCRLAGEHGWRRGVAAVLRLAVEQLDAEVPASVLSAIGANQIEPALLEEALDHVLACVLLPDALLTAPNVAKLYAPGTEGRLGLIWRRLFIPRAELALRYGVSADRPWLVLYYARRAFDLAKKYSASAWAAAMSDPALMEAMARHQRLARWVAGG